MCGIAGFVGDGEKQDLAKMADCLAHRGPDAEGFWHDSKKRIHLAHKRLSIIDLEGGAQPMSTEDGALTIVYNGEIYNHLELRRELESKGHRFHTSHSDTETLLFAYRQWGAAFPKKLNGMWAFAIYDRNRNQIFFSRDRFGKKPLYYSLQNGTFAFSSELKSLIQHRRISAEISKESLKKYFAYGFIPAPRSIYKNIFKLPAGCNLIFDLPNFRMSVIPYWRFVIEPFEKLPKHPEQEWGEQIRELLAAAVKRRMVSDVPLGVFLSGGIDSSSIAAYASKFSAHRLKTFSIGFSEKSFDETDFSDRMAFSLGADHRNRQFSIDSALDVLPDVIQKLDEPLGDSSLLPTFLLCRETRKTVTVAVGGDGADELFAGYDPFHALRLARMYDRLVPKPMHQALRSIAAILPVSHKNMSLDFKIKRTLRGLSYLKKIWNPVWLGPLEPSELQALFQEPMDLEDLYSEAIESWDHCTQENIVDKTLQFYTDLYLRNDITTKIDRASMMNSLEVRSPYLDVDLVDFVRRIPSNFKYRNGQTKYILKKALEGVLPKAVLYRRKHGFGIPVGKWFREQRLLVDFSEEIPFGSKDFLHGRYEEHVRGEHDHRLFLWNYWILNKVLRSHEKCR